ncbi:MAG: hypothetical protein M0Q53_18640 [Prolixibacteraceae bacterium]|jgi:hypothetical protein|nr:hypothetical protein [Prolixibacteraceae bacterium]
MNNFNDLSKDDLLVLNGGASLAYRVGQAIAIAWDLTFGGLNGVFDTKGGILAMNDWFG